MGLCCGASQARRDRSADYEERRKQELLEALGEGYNGELDFAESETASELPTPGRESYSGEETPSRSPSRSGTTSRRSRSRRNVMTPRTSRTRRRSRTGPSPFAPPGRRRPGKGATGDSRDCASGQGRDGRRPRARGAARGG